MVSRNELEVKLSIDKRNLASDARAAGRTLDKAIGDVDINVTADISAASRGLDRLAKQTRRLRDVTGKLNDALGGLASQGAFAALNAITGAVQGAASAFAGFVGSVLEVGGAAQQAEVAFTTILGSAEAAEETLASLREFAATTPFELPEVTAAGRSLLAFGEGAETLADTLRRVGDVSAGVGAPLGEIVEIYGKARVQGRLFAEDINQLTGRGIPIIGELANQFGVSEVAVKELVEEGQVGFAELEQAFISLTEEGGKFGGLMAAQAATIPGQITNIQDTFTQLQITIFEAFGPLTEGILQTFNAILTEIGSSGLSLDPITEAANRLNLELTSSPEIAASLGEAFTTIGEEIINQIVGILDALTAFLAEEGNIELVAETIGGLAIAVEAVGVGIRIFVALADTVAQFLVTAEGLPVVGEYLANFLKFPTPLNALRQSIAALGDAFSEVGEVFKFVFEEVSAAASRFVNSQGVQAALGVLSVLQPGVRPAIEQLGLVPTASGFAGGGATPPGGVSGGGSDRLAQAIERAASRPQTVNITTPDPIADASKILSDLGQLTTAGVNP